MLRKATKKEVILVCIKNSFFSFFFRCRTRLSVFHRIRAERIFSFLFNECKVEQEFLLSHKQEKLLGLPCILLLSTENRYVL